MRAVHSADGSRPDGLPVAASRRDHRVRFGKVALASARRRESQMLRRLGRLTMEALARRQSVDLEEPQVRAIFEELLRADREIALLLDRLKQVSGSHPRDENLPSPPGADRHFPFRR